MKVKGEHFIVLDSWRGICAMMIAILHFSGNSHILQAGILANLWVFVDFFFVLSGFVIFYNYGSMNSAAELRRFIWLRFFRLYPLHLAFLALMVLLYVPMVVMSGWLSGGTAAHSFSGDHSPWTIVTNLLLIHGLGVHSFATWNTPSWSISTEFYMYLLFGVTTLLARRWSVPVLVLFAGLSIVVLAWVGDGLDGPSTTKFFRCIAGFASGVVTCWLHHRLRGIRLGRPAGDVAELACVLAVAVFVHWFCQGMTSIAALPLFMLTVLVFAREAGMVSKALQAAPFRALGLWSYSIYMVHYSLATMFNAGLLAGQKVLGVTLVVNGINDSRLFGANFWHGDVLTLLYLVGVLLLSKLSFDHIERPWRDWARRRFPAG